MGKLNSKIEQELNRLRKMTILAAITVYEDKKGGLQDEKLHGGL